MAREIHDAALVALARSLTGRQATLVGLSRHQERLLAYVEEVTRPCAEAAHG